VIRDFQDSDKEAFLRLNDIFVHWLSPLDEKRLKYILARANYARCAVDPLTDDMIGALISYPHTVDDPDHCNIAWLRQTLDAFQYIDRVIVSASAQGKGVGRRLYADLEHFASQRGLPHLACEVNTRPDNPASHAFHIHQGFHAIGDRDFPEKDTAVRYYAKKLQSVS